MLNLAFLGNPDFALPVLKYLNDHNKINVSLIWTNKPKEQGRGQKIKKSLIYQFCKKHQITCITSEKITEKDTLYLKENSIDLIFVLAYGIILPSHFFETPRLGGYNLHFSLLPFYRGASPVQSAILNGETTSGITIQKINPKMDQGDIVLKKAFKIKDKSFFQIINESIEYSLKSLDLFIKMILNNQVKLIKQKHEDATYCSKIKKSDGFINSSTSLITIKRKFLAFQPKPGIFFSFEKIKYYIKEIGMIKSISDIDYLSNDLVKDKDNYHSLILCKFRKKQLFFIKEDQCLEVFSLQKENKKIMKTIDFLNGSKLVFPLLLDNNQL